MHFRVRDSLDANRKLSPKTWAEERALQNSSVSHCRHCQAMDFEEFVEYD